MQTANLRHTSFLAAAAIVALALPAHTQTRALTTDDYARAEKFLGYNTNRLVLHVAAQPTWVGDDRFWYRTATENGTEFFLVDAATGARTPAFDQAKLAAALSAAARSNYTAYRLPFNQFEFSSRSQVDLLQRGRQPVDVRRRGRKLRKQGAARRSRRRSCRLTASARRSSATTTSGCATRRRAKKRS